MKHTPFSLDALAKSKPAPAKRKTPATAPKTTPWAKDFFKRMDKVRQALGDKKLV